jgi:hypothetical protein
MMCKRESEETCVRFQVLTAASIKMTTFWDIVTCSLVEVVWRFRGTYCLHHQVDSVSFIALMMEAVRISKTSVYFNETTQRHIPEGCHLQRNYVFVCNYDDVFPYRSRVDPSGV